MGLSILKLLRGKVPSFACACHWRRQLSRPHEKWLRVPVKHSLCDKAPVWGPVAPRLSPRYLHNHKHGPHLACFPNPSIHHKINEVHVLSWAHHRIGMYLAGILALCALLHVSAYGHARGGPSSFEIAPVVYPSPAQEPSKSDTSAQSSSPQPDDRPATQTQGQS